MKNFLNVYIGRFGKGKTLRMLEEQEGKKRLSKTDKIVYALIVLLGVIAFIVSTVLLAKTERAEAAEVISDAFAQHDFVADYNTACDYVLDHHLLGAEYLENRSYRYVVCGWNSVNIYSCVLFTSVPIDFGDLSQWHEIEASDVLCVYVRLDTGEANSYYLGDCGSDSSSIYCDALSLRYTVMKEDDDVNSSPTPTPEPGEAEDAYDKLGFIPQNIKAEYLSNGKWKISYGPSVNEYYAWTSYRVTLPSLYWVEEWEGKTKEEVCTEENIINWRTLSDDVPKHFDILDFVPDEKSTEGYFYIDLRSAIEERWSEKYGDISEDYIDYIIEYAYPEIMVMRTFYDDYGSRVFGPANIVRMYTLSRGSTSNKEDILYGGGNATDSVGAWIGDLSTDLDNDSAVSEIERLQNEIDKKNEQIAELKDKLAATGTSDGGLWDTFNEAAEAIKKASDGFVNIGKAIGNVLSFLPVEVSAMMIAFLTSLLVIAFYWALRGK